MTDTAPNGDQDRMTATAADLPPAAETLVTDWIIEWNPRRLLGTWVVEVRYGE